MATNDTDMIRKVGQFHTQFNQDSHDFPTLPTSKQLAMRVSFLLEEVKELEKAGKDMDIVEIGDAYTDIIYVALGGIHEAGLKKLFQKMFNEVHRSNMTKACKNKAAAKMTIAHCQNIDEDKKEVHTYMMITSKSINRNNYYILREDGKVMKSIEYSPANLRKIIL